MNSNNEKIAVIGIACRFPGAKNVNEYWHNLIDGKDTIKHFTDEELSKFEINYDELKKNPDYVKARGVLEDIDKFDGEFFGMTPKEAAGTDPQHRVWLENAWEAFEDAGCDPVHYNGAIGVFAGGYINTYLLNNILRDPVKLENYIRLRSTESFQIMTGNDVAFIPTKTAYKFNLKGPAINVQTACSTSLVAISQACQSLFSYESDMCLAGGVCIVTPQESGYIYQEGAIPSPDGVCRPFDINAKGTVFSNGIGAVVLKRFEDALRDKDRIYALVSGWALNNDGSNKVSYLAPSIDGQAEVIMMAQSFAEISPEQISYIEAHGTATPLGDPIEIAALKKAFSKKTNKKQFCGIGSVKSNIGHTDAAAGVASFIKTCLAAYHRIIPPTLHFSEPNEHINFENTPFFVQNELKEWNEDRPLIMGVSSFGIGGTNSHVIIEEPPTREKTAESQSNWPDLILLSAKNEYSLNKRKQDLIDFVNSNTDLNIKDISYSLAFGRNHMSNRSYLVATDTSEINDAKKIVDGKVDELISKIAFMFPGQGAQYISMGRDLYNSNKLFRQLLDDGFEIVKSELNEDLKSILFESTNKDDAEHTLALTKLTQPALFIIEYALAKVLEQIKIKPDYLIGHSIGEYTAACIAGVFDFQTALKIVCKRGQLMQSMPSGKMMAVRTSIDKLQSLNSPYFEIGADNSPGFCSISFKTENTDKIKDLLDKNEIKYITLNTSHAFHSASFDPILHEFREYVDQFEMKPPNIQFISCLTGKFITPDEATSGSYWAQQLRNTVRFREGVSLIAENEDVLFLEVGPNTHLSSLVRENNMVSNKKAIITTLGKSGEISEPYKIITAVGNMFNTGVNINFSGLHENNAANKIGLPTYPFKRLRHWIDFEYPKDIGKQLLRVSPKTLAESPVEETVQEKKITQETGSPGRNESIIRDIWKSMIGLEELDLEDNFFDLGGNSLLALQIITRIKEELNQNVSLKTFLENPTIKQLSSIFKEQIVQPDKKDKKVYSTDLKKIPLSFNQKRLWIISQIDSSNPAYNIPFTYHFTGELNLDVFQKSLNVLCERHFVMFSVFKQKKGEPYCDIIPRPVTLDLIDFSNDPPEKSRERIYSFAAEDSRKAFNLESGPLYRFYLLKQDNSNYIFHATINHLLFDGWSFSIFIYDFERIYENLIQNKELDLEEVESCYEEYFRQLQSNEIKLNEESILNFWVENLRGCSSILNFPYDSARKDYQSGYGEKEDIKISTECTLKLREISKKENATIFATVLSAMGLLFQRYSGENDICIGIPVAFRPHSKLENIFGMFVNTVVIRLKFVKDLTFKKIINITKKVALDAIAHQEVPFEKIVETLNPQRSPNINPFFQVSIVWIYHSTRQIELPGAKGEHINIREGVSPFDITFYLWENGEFIEGEIEYNCDILQRETIIRLRDNFLNLIINLAENPDTSIDSLPMMSDADRKMIDGLNETRVNYPKEKTIVQLFEEQVILYPNKSAVHFKKEKITYKQLNEKSNQLARKLRDLGVESNMPVGLIVEKSLDMIVGILGILKAGGAYVPIEPDYPEKRINFMIRDAGCRILLTQKEFMNMPLEGVTKLNLNSPDSYHQEKSNVECINSSSDLAYIMYTSGTTGVPKGSLIQQHCVVRLVRNINYIELTSDDRILLTGAIVFDATTFEIWGALLNGGSLYVVDKETILDPKTLGEELIKNDITILWLTSALFTEIAEIRTDIFSGLKYFLSGGDVLSANHVNKVRKDNPQLKVINCYGPTENTTFSTTYLIEKDFDHNIPIGKPINNSTAFIFDKHLNYQPIGVIGELYVGGDGLSKGYLNRDDLNKTSFIEHPYMPGERLYKTGDHARWLADGNIEFHGRIDNQLKIRGFRVELEEVESAISEIEGIIDTVVKAIKIEKGNTKLAAFLHVTPTFSMDTKKLSLLIREKLPPYMIPSTFKLMNDFPKTINGKIDKDALTFDTNDIVTIKSQDITTLNPTEKTIMGIWREALKTKDILVTDNFFDVGGNSLLAISIFSKIESEFDVNLTLRVFFDSPRIKDLAEIIDILKNRAAEQKSVDIKNRNDSKIIQGEI